MTACLRPTLLFVLLALLLSGCTHEPTTPPLGTLPTLTQSASPETLLQQAERSTPEQAANLRLAAADLQLKQGEVANARRTLELIAPASLLPAQQMFAQTLQAEIALNTQRPQQALEFLAHPSFARLNELPMAQQARTHQARAQALQALDRPLDAIREHLLLDRLLTGQAQKINHEAIWTAVSQLPAEQLQATGDPLLDGWLSLAQSINGAGTLALQKQAIQAWIAAHPGHPAAVTLPQPIVSLQQLADKPIERIALLIPLDGRLAAAGQALQDGFMAQCLSSSDAPCPAHIRIYDSSRIESMDSLYRQAQTDGIELIIGPLEREKVQELAERIQLPVTTLALNYSDSVRAPQLFQFGLAAEDEAREAARQAWADGYRRAIALTTDNDWGQRVRQAFLEAWQRRGGRVIAAEPLAEPVKLASQIARLFNLRESEARARELSQTINQDVAAQPTRRQDADFLFLAATPQQAQQVRPTLIFQYAGDVPIYATSSLHSVNGNTQQYQDLEGIRFTETPWLLNADAPLRRQTEKHWPQAATSLGRLYAMGADAAVLAQRLNQLSALPGMELQGRTGILSLSPDRQVVRTLPWATFAGGQVRRLPATPVSPSTPSAPQVNGNPSPR